MGIKGERRDQTGSPVDRKRQNKKTAEITEKQEADAVVRAREIR